MVAVFGHRGARGLVPENTSAGFALANELKLTGVEFDVGMTADAMAVVHHDPRLNPNIARAIDGAYVGVEAPLLCEASYQQLQAYDVGRLRAGSDYAARFSTQRPLDGTRIPTLDMVLEQCKGLDLLVEVKTSPEKPDETSSPQVLARATIERLRGHGLLQNTVLYAFDWRVLDEAAVVEPSLKRCCLTEADTVKNATLWFGKANLANFNPQQPGSLPRLVASTGAKVWAPDHETLNAYEVEQAHELGLTIIPWTVNEPEDIMNMIVLGVDGIISDFPDRVLSILAEQGLSPEVPGFISRRCSL